MLSNVFADVFAEFPLLNSCNEHHAERPAIGRPRARAKTLKAAPLALSIGNLLSHKASKGTGPGALMLKSRHLNPGAYNPAI